MSWNRSSEERTFSEKRKGFRFSTLGVIAIGIVVFGTAGIVWWLNRSNENVDKVVVERQKVLLNEVTPSAATKAEQPKPKKYKDMTTNEKLQYYRDKYGDNLPDNLKPIVYYLENEPKVNYRRKSNITSIFKHRSEREIAAFLMVEPGTWMMRPVEFGDKFDKDLATALEDKIEITEDDTEEQRQLKQAVIDAKADLLAQAKDGKSPSKIMSEASNELYLLGKYKRDLEDEVRAVKNDPTKSEDDLRLTVEAANKMLEKKGLKPLRQPNMLIRRANLKKAKRKAEKANSK